jgi:NADH-quinone oxidoreductase subunit H
MTETIQQLFANPFVVHGVKIAAVLAVLMTGVAYAVLLERWVSAWIQDRVGPNRVGFDLGQKFLPKFSFWGLGQPLADGLKFMFKEQIVPAHVNKIYYFIAPCIAMIPPLLTIAVIPFGSKLGGELMVIADLDIGILFIFAIASLGVYGIVLAGWASNSKYPFLGGIRSSAQMISYEVSLGLSVVSVFMLTGTLRLGGFDAETGAPLGVIGHQVSHGWLLFTQPLAAFIFLVSAFAETNRTPFDLPEAEQELVGGYHTEYGAMKFGMFFLGEYAAMFVASAAFVTLFLGGWTLPVIYGWAPEFITAFNQPAQTLGMGIAHIGVFLAKVGALIFFYMWVRWTLPRFRFDQLMDLGWKVFLHLALANIILTGLVMAMRAR